MSRDPFEIGKVDSKKSIGHSQAPSHAQQIGQNAAAARAGEGASSVTPQAPAQSVPAADRVQFSPDVDDAPNAGLSSNLAGLASWATPPAGAPTETSDTSKVNKAGEAQAAGNFTITQAPPAGMGGGALGANGAISGQAPGMAAGGVFTTPRINQAA